MQSRSSGSPVRSYISQPTATLCMNVASEEETRAPASNMKFRFRNSDSGRA